MFSDRSIKRIIKESLNFKISRKAVEKFKKITEDGFLIIARKAVKNAQYSGRKIIKPEDINEAIKTQ